MSAASNQDAGTVSRFAGTLIELLDRVEYRRVSVEDQLDPVYRLRYEAYRREDFIPINSQQVVRDEFDDLPNSHCFGVYIDGELVSSVRFHYLTAKFRTSPSHSVFPDILDPLLDRGYTILDPGRFTADYEASLAYPALPYLTLRIPTVAVPYFNVRYVLSTVRPEHAAFYRRVYRSEQLGEARYYHGLSFPMVLMACDIPVMYQDMLRRYPFFRSTREERETLFGGPGRSSIAAVRPSARLAQRLAELEEVAPA
jgi:hypothetical protein